MCNWNVQMCRFKAKKMNEPLLKWQKKTVNWIKFQLANEDDRTIGVVVDRVGGTGKDHMVKYLVHHFNAGFMRWTSAHGATYMVCKHPRPIWCVNLSRTRPESVKEGDLYSTLEQIKDGFMFNDKYEGQMVMREPPIVIVFTNEDLKAEKLSGDRWDVFILGPEDVHPNTKNRKRFDWSKDPDVPELNQAELEWLARDEALPPTQELEVKMSPPHAAAPMDGNEPEALADINGRGDPVAGQLEALADAAAEATQMIDANPDREPQSTPDTEWKYGLMTDGKTFEFEPSPNKDPLVRIMRSANLVDDENSDERNPRAMYPHKPKRAASQQGAPRNLARYFIDSEAGCNDDYEGGGCDMCGRVGCSGDACSD